MSEQIERNRLFIKKIIINNCNAFYGKDHTITFPDNPDENITVIRASNGQGKTSLHNLLYWGLYGEFKQQDNDKGSSVDEGLINSHALENLELGESTEASVEITINDENGERFILERSVKATLKRETSKRITEERNNSQVSDGLDWSEDVTLKLKSASGDREILTNPAVISNEIGKLFPLHLSDFFLFDGEKLEKFENAKNNSQFIRDGIIKISESGIINQLSEHSQLAYREIRRNSGEESMTATPYQKIFDKKDLELKTIDIAISDLQKKQQAIKDNIDNCIEKINQGKEGRSIQKKQDEYDRLLKTAKKDLKQNQSELKDFLFEKIPILLSISSLKNAEKIFDKLETDDKIPPKISRGAIDKILNSSPLRCVCGREFEESDEKDSPWVILHKIREAIIDDDLSKDISVGRTVIERMVDTTNPEKLNAELQKFFELRKDKNDQITEFTAERQECAEKLANNKEDPQDWGAKKKDLEVEYDEIVSKIADKQRVREEIDRDFKLAEKELNKAIMSDSKFDKEQIKMKILDSIRKFSQKLEKKVEEKLRIQTEKMTYERFHEIFVEASKNKDTEAQEMAKSIVKIDKDYVIDVKSDSLISKRISKGQAHILGLSYVTGIRKITNTNSFIAIDSPFHNISGLNKEQVAKTLSKFLKGTQLIFFVTDVEYTQKGEDMTSSVKDIFNESKALGKEYIIKTQESGGINSRTIKEEKL